ncbi:hypothetical protein AKJ16_DCAP10284 [Drosera capensis]
MQSSKFILYVCFVAMPRAGACQCARDINRDTKFHLLNTIEIHDRAEGWRHGKIIQGQYLHCSGFLKEMCQREKRERKQKPAATLAAVLLVWCVK